MLALAIAFGVAGAVELLRCLRGRRARHATRPTASSPPGPLSYLDSSALRRSPSSTRRLPWLFTNTCA